MINKCVLLILGLSLILLGGCVPTEQVLPEQTGAPVSETTAPLSESTLSSNLAQATTTPLPTPSPTHRLVTPTPAVSPTPSLVPTITVHSRCSAAEPLQVEASPLLRGLVFTIPWQGETWTGVLGQAGFRTPALILDDPERSGHVEIAPGREWLAHMNFLAVDENLTRMKVKLIKPLTLEEKERVFESRAPLVSFGAWVNDTTYLIATTTAGEGYEWLLWEPFTDQERTLTLELTGMGNAIEIFHTAPVLDPTMTLVVYPCDRHQCGGAEYQVKSLDTGESLWTIDFEPLHPFRNRPMWSPDGQYLGILLSSNDLRQDYLRIYDRSGVLVYNFALPRAGIDLTWSPDSQHLAFFRTVPDPLEEVVRVLTYLDLKEGAIYDLCLTDVAGAYPIVWSPDGTKLAINAQLEYAEDPPALLSIVDIVTGEILQVYQTEWHALMGWIKPIGE
jgi:hypothetical protein